MGWGRMPLKLEMIQKTIIRKTSVREIHLAILLWFALSASAVLGTVSMASAQCTVTGATLNYYADDFGYFYLNGTLLTSCTTGTCYQTLSTYVLTPAQWALINPSPAQNLLSIYNSDTAGSLGGVNYDLRITYSNCATQDIVSNGFCTDVLYAGNYDQGTTIIPVGWNTLGYNDGAWTGPYSSTTVPSGWPYSLTNAAGVTIPWMWGTNPFYVLNGGDGYLYRQYFVAGNTTACAVTPLPHPLPSTTPPPHLRWDRRLPLLRLGPFAEPNLGSPIRCSTCWSNATPKTTNTRILASRFTTGGRLRSPSRISA
jgi:hypothetical protein